MCVCVRGGLVRDWREKIVRKVVITSKKSKERTKRRYGYHADKHSRARAAHRCRNKKTYITHDTLLVRCEKWANEQMGD